MANDITTVHPLLEARLDQIRRSRDTYSGSDDIKGISEVNVNVGLGHDQEYLPKLTGQSKAQYENYKGRAVFYATMSRTVSALVGAIDRKPPTINNGEGIQSFTDDVTGTGIDAREFFKEVQTEVLISGRAIVCVDRKNSDNNRPYLVFYKSEDCVNWFSEDYTDFDKKLTRMVFRESYYAQDEDNIYKTVQKDQYREFVLSDNGDVTVNLWRSSGKEVMLGGESGYEITDSYPLTNRGKPLGFIPCVSVVASGSALEVPKPPMLDLVDVNLAHYRNSADYEHGMHWTALPTPVLTGLNSKESKISIGSGSAIVLPDPQSKAMFLEFSGSGLATIKTAMDHKEQMMSALGARMLASRMDQSTSAEVARINYSGETATLCNVARSISRGMTRLLRMVANWENVNGFEGIEVHLNEDYVDTKLAGPDITALMSAYQGGALSLDSLIWNLSQGERLPGGRTIDDEIALIEADMDREAEEALAYEDEDIGFSGARFSSAEGSASKKQEQQPEGEGEGETTPYFTGYGEE